jgi:hypothetical protein
VDILFSVRDICVTSMGAFRYGTEDDTNANSWDDYDQHVGKSYRSDLWIFCFRVLMYNV